MNDNVEAFLQLSRKHIIVAQGQAMLYLTRDAAVELCRTLDLLVPQMPAAQVTE